MPFLFADTTWNWKSFGRRSQCLRVRQHLWWHAGDKKGDGSQRKEQRERKGRDGKLFQPNVCFRHGAFLKSQNLRQMERLVSQTLRVSHDPTSSLISASDVCPVVFPGKIYFIVDESGRQEEERLWKAGGKESSKRERTRGWAVRWQRRICDWCLQEKAAGNARRGRKGTEKRAVGRSVWKCFLLKSWRIELASRIKKGTRWIILRKCLTRAAVLVFQNWWTSQSSGIWQASTDISSTNRRVKKQCLTSLRKASRRKKTIQASKSKGKRRKLVHDLRMFRSRERGEWVVVWQRVTGSKLEVSFLVAWDQVGVHVFQRRFQEKYPTSTIFQQRRFRFRRFTRQRSSQGKVSWAAEVHHHSKTEEASAHKKYR